MIDWAAVSTNWHWLDVALHGATEIDSSGCANQAGLEGLLGGFILCDGFPEQFNDSPGCAYTTTGPVYLCTRM